MDAVIYRNMPSYMELHYVRQNQSFVQYKLENQYLVLNIIFNTAWTIL